MTQMPLAIIGTAVRLPGADTVEKYWSDTFEGKVHIRRFTPDELIDAGVPEEDARAPEFVGASALLDNVSGFDAAAFGMSPREAAITDPQHRLFLEVCEQALESSGYSGATSRVGLMGNTGFHLHPLEGYLRRSLDGRVFDADFPRNHVTGLQVVFGNHTDFVATKAAFRLGLTGPVMTVQTGCSSGLVGVRLAGQALRDGDADIMVVASAAVHVPQILGHRHVKGSVSSRTGCCRVFDAASDGTVTGNGAAAVVLKRLDQALADGDAIEAVVLATAVNNDGDSKAAYAAPSAVGQSAVIAQALDTAGIDCGQIGYVETHGTGTFKGDPIEFDALDRVYRGRTTRTGYCALGSAKANIGHLDSGAALPGLIRAIGVLRHGVIPPLAGHTAPNPRLNLTDSPFYLPDRARSWPDDLPRLAAVTGLGVGGTNAHLILGLPQESAPARPRRGARPTFLPLSAATSEALVALATDWLEHLTATPGLAADSVAATAGAGRRHHRQRLALIGSTIREWRDGLTDFIAGEDSDRYLLGTAGRAEGLDPVAPSAEAYRRGVPITWAGGHPRLRLPTYPYQRTRHWIGPPPPQEEPAPTPSPTGEESMSFDQVLAHVRATAAKQLGHPLEQITPDTSFLELGADSLIMVDLARGLEETYGVKVTMRELFEDGATPTALATLVTSRMPAAPPSKPEPAVPVASAAPVAPAPVAPAAPAPIPAQIPVPTSVPTPVPAPAPQAPPIAVVPPPAAVPPIAAVPPPVAVPPAPPASPPVPWMPPTPYGIDPAHSARTIEALTAQVQQLLSINQQLTYQLSQLTAMLRADRSVGGQG